MPAHALQCHPALQCEYVDAIDVRADWVLLDQLSLRYRVTGQLGRLRLPATGQPAFTHGLWQHTCFEAFVTLDGARAYLESNFSPSGEWALYTFDDYRLGMQPHRPRQSPVVVCRRGDDVLEIDVTLHLGDWLAPAADDLRMGAAAVLEDRHGQLSYWALAHPSARPDFHHADSFVMPLPRAGAGA